MSASWSGEELRFQIGQRFVRANGYCPIRLSDAVLKYLHIGDAH